MLVRLLRNIIHFRNTPQFFNGHFYSPVIDRKEVDLYHQGLWNGDLDFEKLGIQFNQEEQRTLLEAFKKFYASVPHLSNKSEDLRYSFENGQYSYTDAIFLHCMLRYFKPKKLIEIGSGHSSAMTLDTNEYCLEDSVDLTFIEPYPERLNSLLKEKDKKKVSLHVNKVQDVDLNVFAKLSKGDFLFVDSSHISKTASDLNFILFEVLPHLKAGVIIHFHDIFYPFEYPPKWIKQSRNWNETYFLKAFLMFNPGFEIILFSDYLNRKIPKAFDELEICKKNTGANLWLRKVK